MVCRLQFRQIRRATLAYPAPVAALYALETKRLDGALADMLDRFVQG
jgi:hypothetical protein